ncbi:MAG: hypothetical protein WCK85_10165 [Chlorobium sp.]
MGVKELFSAIFTILFRYRKFWLDLRQSNSGEEFNVLRDYAVPVIALVQLAKFPLIGVPRSAMFFAGANFLIDIAALYLLAGGAAYLLDRERSESIQSGTLTVFSYAMTPVWIFELFCFTGNWSSLFAFFALAYTLVIARNGLVVLLRLDSALSATALRNIALLALTVNSATFLLVRALIRLFHF